MLKRIFFIRPLIVSVFFLLFVDLMATEEEDATVAQKQQFLQENIEQGCQDAFAQFLNNKKEGGDNINNWTMRELEQVVKEFHQQQAELAEKEQMLLEEIVGKEYDKEKFIIFAKQEKGENGDDLDIWSVNELRNAIRKFQLEEEKQKGNAQEKLDENEQKEEDEEIIENNKSEGVNNNILQTNKKDELEIKNENNNVDTEIIGQNNEQKLLTNEEQGGDKSTLQDSFFIFYRYGGKFLTSLVWSVVNSYCGFEQLVMNDWYCFKYAMCSGYRLQPRFMGSRVWIDMNFNFLEGIAGFLIRFFLFEYSYNMYENIFDFFNVCIDIKVYNNLYFAVNIVGFVRSIVLLSILSDKFTNPFLQHEI